MSVNTSKNNESVAEKVWISITYHGAVEVISVGTLDFHRRDLADPQRPAALDENAAVDTRGVALAPALGDAWT